MYLAKISSFVLAQILQVLGRVGAYLCKFDVCVRRTCADMGKRKRYRDTDGDMDVDKPDMRYSVGAALDTMKAVEGAHTSNQQEEGWTVVGPRGKKRKPNAQGSRPRAVEDDLVHTSNGERAVAEGDTHPQVCEMFHFKAPFRGHAATICTYTCHGALPKRKQPLLHALTVDEDGSCADHD